MIISTPEIIALRSIPQSAYVEIDYWIGDLSINPPQIKVTACIVRDEDYGRCGKHGDALAEREFISVWTAIDHAFELSGLPRGDNRYFPDPVRLSKAITDLGQNCHIIISWDNDGDGIFARWSTLEWLVSEDGEHFGYGGFADYRESRGCATVAEALEQLKNMTDYSTHHPLPYDAALRLSHLQAQQYAVDRIAGLLRDDIMRGAFTDSELVSMMTAVHCAQLRVGDEIAAFDVYKRSEPILVSGEAGT